MKEEGFVKKIEGDKAVVVVRRKTACGDNCASCQGACKKSFQEITAKNLCGAKAGDFVTIEMDNKKVYLSAFLVYILPLFVFLASFVIGERYWTGKINATVSILLAVLSFIPAIALDRRKKDEFVHRIVQICKNT